jgi:hypothetical protein
MYTEVSSCSSINGAPALAGIIERGLQSAQKRNLVEQHQAATKLIIAGSSHSDFFSGAATKLTQNAILRLAWRMHCRCDSEVYDGLDPLYFLWQCEFERKSTMPVLR